MKTAINTKPNQNSVESAALRGNGIRPHAAKTLEHRYERRKIREQLRRLDWALNAEEEVFA